ncbi:MAG: hypothetical protein V1798_02100 [Pseudomonadota bacterium]
MRERGTRNAGFMLLLMLAAACGGSSALTVDIELAANQPGNPLVQINTDLRNATSTGIYFQFDQLNCPPASVTDVVAGGNVVKIPNPDNGEAGDSPLTDQFQIQPSQLQPSTFYRVWMYEKYLGAVRYQGFGDCPINLALGASNHSTICFGLDAPLPICPGLTARFLDCPGVGTTTDCQ